MENIQVLDAIVLQGNLPIYLALCTVLLQGEPRALYLRA
jgi:hypothetical protein